MGKKMEQKIDQEERLQKLPGLFRDFELAQHFADRRRFHHQRAGTLRDNTPVYFVFLQPEEALGNYVDELLCSPPDTLPSNLHCELCGGGPKAFELIDGGRPGEKVAVCRVCGAERRIGI